MYPPLGPVEMFVNGVRQKLGEHFTVDDQTLIWLNNGFGLAPSDDVTFSYRRG